MVQTISINLSHGELTTLISDAVTTAINSRLEPIRQDELLTISQAAKYLKCSTVFIWKRRKEGKLESVGAGKKILIRMSSIDAYLNQKKGGMF